MKIRRSNDIALIKSLDKICLPGCVWYPGEYWWVVLDGDTPVGYAGLAHSRQWQSTGYLCRAGIIPEYRGRGLQKRLIYVRIKLARKLGFVALVTDTRRNPSSANSLIACGFKLYEPQAPWSFVDANYWRLWL